MANACDDVLSFLNDNALLLLLLLQGHHVGRGLAAGLGSRQVLLLRLPFDDQLKLALQRVLVVLAHARTVTVRVLEQLTRLLPLAYWNAKLLLDALIVVLEVETLYFPLHAAEKVRRRARLANGTRHELLSLAR